jgi:hypothetical protein
MIDLNFDTKEKKANAIAQFTSLLEHPGWQMVEAIVRFNIQVIQDQLMEGGTNETLEDVNRLRDKLIAHKEIIDTPRTMIGKLKPQEKTEQENDDPYL